MKKTLIASAVAAATLSTSAFAMDPASDLAARLDSMPSVYGNIQLAIDYTDADTESGVNFVDNGSTIGFKHKHELSPGTEAFFKAEFHFDADDQSSNRGLGERLDEAYIGVKGDFGQVWAGQDDSLYEWVDVTDQYEYLGVPGELDSGEANSIFYTTPSMSGFTAGIQIMIDDEGSNGSNGEHNVILAGKYAMDNLEVTAAVDMHDGPAQAGGTSFGIGATYTMGDIAVAAQYETQDENKDVFGLLGSYTMGANKFMASYHLDMPDASGADDTNVLSAQALHNLSDNMYVYAEVQFADNDTTESSSLILGGTYAF